MSVFLQVYHTLKNVIKKKYPQEKITVELVTFMNTKPKVDSLSRAISNMQKALQTLQE